jgi:hypothetical protein
MRCAFKRTCSVGSRGHFYAKKEPDLTQAQDWSRLGLFQKGSARGGPVPCFPLGSRAQGTHVHPWPLLEHRPLHDTCTRHRPIQAPPPHELQGSRPHTPCLISTADVAFVTRNPDEYRRKRRKEGGGGGGVMVVLLPPQAPSAVHLGSLPWTVRLTKCKMQNVFVRAPDRASWPVGAAALKGEGRTPCPPLFARARLAQLHSRAHATDSTKQDAYDGQGRAHGRMPGCRSRSRHQSRARTPLVLRKAAN